MFDDFMNPPTIADVDANGYYKFEQSEVDKIMANGGLLSQKLQNYNERKSQISLANSIYGAFINGRNLLAEAPTGIGKSLAGLIPAVLVSMKYGYKIVISTSTKALQNQYYEKDLPFLHRMFDGKFSYAMMKGRSNYLCKRRLDAFGSQFIAGQKIQYFDTITQYEKLRDWVSITTTGDLETVGFDINSELRNEIICDVDECDGKECLYRRECFYNKCKAIAKTSNIVLVNTDLFCIDLIVRNTSPVSVIPNYDLAIVDEAHTFENIFSKYVGFKVSPYSVNIAVGFATKYTKECLKNASKDDVDTYQRYYDILLEKEKKIRKYSKLFFSNFQFDTDKETIRLHSYDYNPRVFVYGRRLINSLKHFANSIHIDTSTDVSHDKGEKAVQKIDEVCAKLEKLVGIEEYEDDFVYWVTYSKKGEPIIECSPIDVSSTLHNYLFERPDVNYWDACHNPKNEDDVSVKLKPRSVIMMSATLTTNNSFGFMMNRLGISNEDTDTLKLNSDFDFNHHCLLYIPSGIIEPNVNKKISDAFTIQTANNIIRLIKITHGKMLCLFTSYSEMEKVYDIVSHYQFGRKYNIFNQNQLPKNKLNEMFKQDVDSILFATSSYWTGVDFQGETLSALVIDKIPFPVPSEPIIEARIDRIKKKGGDWFNDYYIPMAIMDMCQGFGRLIRTKDDMGIVMICDKRLVSKGYGKKFLNSFPKTKRTRKIRMVKVFWEYVLAKRRKRNGRN